MTAAVEAAIMFHTLSRTERARRYRGSRLLSHAIVHLSRTGNGDAATLDAMSLLLGLQWVVLGIR